MPTAGEIVSNRPLAGSDLAKIILADVAQMLEGNGMMSGHIAYGRVAYDIRVTLHLDNPTTPTDISVIRSGKRAENYLVDHPEESAIEEMPLTGADAESFVTSTERSRVIDSPNAARLAHGLPLAVTRRDSSGQYMEEAVKYPTSAAPDDYPEAADVDLTRMAREAFNLPPKPTYEDIVKEQLEYMGEHINEALELAPAEEHSPVPEDNPSAGKSGHQPKRTGRPRKAQS